MFERFAPETREAVRRAAEIAETERAAVVQAEHLLLALVDPVRDGVGQALVDGGIAADAIGTARDAEFRSALAAVGVDTDRPVPPASSRLRRGRTTRFAPSAKVSLERALASAVEDGARRVSNRHLLAGIVRTDAGRTPQLLSLLGTSRDDLLRLAWTASTG